jgi:hypothetical protein
MEALIQIHLLSEQLLKLTPDELSLATPVEMSSRESQERLQGCDFALGNYGIKRLDRK